MSTPFVKEDQLMKKIEQRTGYVAKQIKTMAIGIVAKVRAKGNKKD